MEHKNKEGPAESPRISVAGHAFDYDEFDEVETSSLAEFLADDAVDGGAVAKDAHIRVMATNLATSLRRDDAGPLPAGYVLSERFEIVELVHSGGMGRVYKAIDHRRHRDGAGTLHVGIKMMRGSVGSPREVRLALEREAAQAQLLSHPNIINVFDFDEHEGHFYIVMEWLQGESVKDLLRRTTGQKITPEFAWSIIEKAAAGLQHAHAHNVVHADINPGNIFITDTQEIKILDFGVARTCVDPEDLADERIAWATQTYASPEVLTGSTPVFADDIFSLACIAYRLLSGKHPFAGSSAIVAQREGVTVESIPGLAESEWRLLSHALSFERADRPQSAATFLRKPASMDDLSVDFLPQFSLPDQWLRIAAAAAIVITMGGLWLWQGTSRDESVADVEATVTDELPGVVTEATSSLDEIGALLSSAAQAMSEERYVLPQDNNARLLYRDALALEPANPSALRGLRSISDVYVQRADAALRVGDPLGAAAYLTIAAETDPANPAIAIVNSLLVAQGDRYLADARLAAEDGNAVRAANLLLMAEQYDHIDSNSIDSIREQLEQSVQDEQIAEQPLAASVPTLATSRPEPGREPAAQQSAEGTVAIKLPTAEPDNALATNAVADASATIPDSRPRQPDSSAVAADSAPPATSEPDIMALAAPSSGAAAAEDPASGTAAVNRSPAPRYRRLQDLGIEKYVAPKYPRSARRRGRSGFVEVAFDVNPDGSTGAIEVVRGEPGEIFNSSAVNAVEQWRFARQREPVRAIVTLRFAVEQ